VRPILLIGGNFVRMQWLIVVIMTVYIAGIAGVFSLNQESQEVLFFVRSQPLYILFLSLMLGVPAIQTDRKSRRLLAVLSKGIHRWQYLGGLLCGCTVLCGVFTLLIWGTAYMLFLREARSTSGLWLLILALFACCVTAAAAGLLYSTFLHPLLATGVATITLLLPIPLAARGMDMRILKLFFPVADMVNHLVDYQYGAVEDLWTVTVTAIILAIVFWMAGAMIFARRDVTISPE
jgi:ABC-type transport system involved in multi-copper enzyme maturation permease subunit